LLKPLVENPKITGLFKRIRMLTEALGPVRSLDVALNDLRERFTDLEGHRPSLPLLIEWVRKRRKKLRKRLPQEISEVQILKTLRKFKPQEIPHLPSEDLQTMLEKKLTKALRNLEKNWNLFHKKQKIADLHHLRVDLKKWRYLFEIKSEIMGIPGAADFLEKVKNLQDRLGGIHDLEVLQETVSSPKFRRIAQENKVQKDLRGFVKDLRNQMDQELQLFLKEGEKAIMEIIAFTQGVYSLALAEPDAC
jgi:CHAD domain-containing protein